MRRAIGALLILVTAGLVTASLTALFLGMRSVMDIGGTCASGGPYEIEKPCPGHVAALLPASIWAGLIFTGLYVVVALKWGVPSFVSLLWPALFLSLAYNFFDYAVRGDTVQVGWLLCGIVFGLMGAVPLLWAMPHLWRVYGRGEEGDRPWHVAATGAAVGTLRNLNRFTRPAPDVAGSLERLADLHEKGALDDFEYAKAKDRVIRGEQP